MESQLSCPPRSNPSLRVPQPLVTVGKPVSSVDPLNILFLNRVPSSIQNLIEDPTHTVYPDPNPMIASLSKAFPLRVGVFFLDMIFLTHF